MSQAEPNMEGFNTKSCWTRPASSSRREGRSKIDIGAIRVEAVDKPLFKSDITESEVGSVVRRRERAVQRGRGPLKRRFHWTKWAEVNQAVGQTLRKKILVLA